VDECEPLHLGHPAADGGRGGARRQGRVVQVVSIKPKLKPPGNKRLKLTCGVLLSHFAFKFNLRRYSKAGAPDLARLLSSAGAHLADGEFQVILDGVELTKTKTELAEEQLADAAVTSD
jgi:hypothetical protein